MRFRPRRALLGECPRATPSKGNRAGSLVLESCYNNNVVMSVGQEPRYLPGQTVRRWISCVDRRVRGRIQRFPNVLPCFVRHYVARFRIGLSANRKNRGVVCPDLILSVVRACCLRRVRKLYCNFNHIRVRSFILNGAPRLLLKSAPSASLSPVMRCFY